MKTRTLIIAAKVLSILFTPFYLPIAGLVALFLFSYLSLLPWGYKLFVLALVYLFTALLPTLLIRVYHRYEGWSFLERMAKERRLVPYIISILCYFLCCYLMQLFHIPHFMRSIVFAALVIQMACALTNVWWKVSTHTAAIGGMAGALAAFSIFFSYNPVWWLCLIIIIAGVVGTSRMIMRQHTLGQVTGGFLLGLVAAFLTIIWM